MATWSGSMAGIVAVPAALQHFRKSPQKMKNGKCHLEVLRSVCASKGGSGLSGRLLVIGFFLLWDGRRGDAASAHAGCSCLPTKQFSLRFCGCVQHVVLLGCV